jgi:hypothetical protein
LTWAAYRECGLLAGALAKHADRVFKELAAFRRGTTKELLVSLCGERHIKRGVKSEPLIAELARRCELSEPELRELLDRLVAARLVTSYADAETGARCCELACEELATRWQMLARWRAERLHVETLRDETEQAALLWQKRGGNDQDLWGGAAFEEARRVPRADRGAAGIGQTFFARERAGCSWRAPKARVVDCSLSDGRGGGGVFGWSLDKL